ncbi:potassium transporter [Thermotoga sp. KOL6]|nr:potassium transporter [Thermotoga sp. KOL6]
MASTKHRLRVSFWYVGQLLAWFPAILLLPVVFVIFYPEEWKYITAFLVPAVVSFVSGYLLKKISKLSNGHVVGYQEGAVIVVTTWIVAILLSASPFIITGFLNFHQAIFEATSGWTTTGLTMFPDVESLPHVLLVWRSIMQFIGGAGFAVIMLATLIGPLGASLYGSEGRVDNILPNVTQSTKVIMIIYVTYAVLGMVLLHLAGMPWFDAFNHSLTALATGGFSVKNTSIGFYNSVSIETITIVLMILGGTGFGIHYTLWKGNFKAFLRNGEPWLMGTTIVLATVFLVPHASKVFHENALRYTIFQVVSAITGTGFSNTDLVPWVALFPLGVFLLTVIMMLGGMMDSTAGGLKQFRVFVTLKLLVRAIRDFVGPRRKVGKIMVWKGESRRTIDENIIKDMFIFFGIYALTYLLGTLVLMSYGYDPLVSMFEFSSAMNGVGLSVGLTSPDLPVGVLWTMTLGMFLGRLEFLVVFYALARIIRDLKILLTENGGEIN